MPTVNEALNIGWSRHQAGDLSNAESIYRQVLEVVPHNENAWCFLGMACHDQGRYEEAVECYHRALELKPEFPVALSNLGNTLKQLGRLDEAVESCRRALAYQPDYATAYNNLAVALVAQGQLREAAEYFERALQLTPQDAVAQANLGAALIRQGRFDEGSARAQAALQLNPRYADAHKNQAIIWLLHGDFERGWPEYEWRWQCPGNGLPHFERPAWEGEALANKTLLLYAEQGLGDTIHFIRYAQLLRQDAARVLAAVQKPLLPLLASAAGCDELVPQNGPYPDYDLFIPMLSVPRVLKTDLDNIPNWVPYLAADPRLVAHWKPRLEKYPGLRIGIAWQGSPDFHADRQRSIPLRSFAPLAEVPGVTLFSLQKGYGSEQLEELQELFPVVDFGQELDEQNGPFMDTAAIMTHLDLVITADTSLAHLAGALAVPVWIALSLAPDWRWLLDREDCPWYPTARLFRQRELDNWGEVFQRMAAALSQLQRPQRA